MEIETLMTQSLILKKLTPEVYNFIFETLSKEEIQSFFGHTSEEEYILERTKFEKGYSTHRLSIATFQMLDKTSHEIIGACGFHNWYLEHNRAELGYSMLKENYKRKGLMTEAVKAIIHYGFTTMNLHRIEALVGSDNKASLRIIEKHNFKREGLLRQHYFVNGNYEDSIIYSLLKEEYINQN
jgi:[ribosomal protein S5]-alanine N-acetyltransferase